MNMVLLSQVFNDTEDNMRDSMRLQNVCDFFSQSLQHTEAVNF